MLTQVEIQENYLKSTPELAASPTGNPKERECNEMELIAKAADAIADGDLVDTMIHGWVYNLFVEIALIDVYIVLSNIGLSCQFIPFFHVFDQQATSEDRSEQNTVSLGTVYIASP